MHCRDVDSTAEANVRLAGGTAPNVSCLRRLHMIFQWIFATDTVRDRLHVYMLLRARRNLQPTLYPFVMYRNGLQKQGCSFQSHSFLDRNQSCCSPSQHNHKRSSLEHPSTNHVWSHPRNRRYAPTPLRDFTTVWTPLGTEHTRAIIHHKRSLSILKVFRISSVTIQDSSCSFEASSLQGRLHRAEPLAARRLVLHRARAPCHHPNTPTKTAG